MITVINYSDERFENARKYNSRTAYKAGRADNVYEYSPDNLPEDAIKINPKWNKRNDKIVGRYGLWRPYIVMDALSKVDFGDYICYCDAGVYFVDDIHKLTAQMEKDNTDIMFFTLPFIEKQWTKREIFVYFNADTKKCTDTQQIMSTFFIVKKTMTSMAFFEEYRNAAESFPEMFTDEANSIGDNYPEFIENRHNQSVLSVLAKKNNYPKYRDPSEYGIKPLLYRFSVPEAIYEQPIYVESSYPQIIVHHRSKSIRMDVKLFAFIRRFFPPRIAIMLFNFGHSIKYFLNKEKWG